MDDVKQLFAKRTKDAVKYWRLLPWYERTEHELGRCMQRHGMTPIDAKAYARNTVAALDDLRPVSLGLRKCFARPGEAVFNLLGDK